MKKRGFTLIELLVVISIVSLLSSVAISSLSSARSKASDGAVKELMHSFKVQAADYFATYGTYGQADQTGFSSAYDPAYTGPCATSVFHCDSQGVLIIKAIIKQSAIGNRSPASYQGILGAAPDGTSYSFTIALSDGSYWCIDSAGHANKVASPLAGGYYGAAVCPSS